MAAITAALVGQLRERTGLGMMECKRALTETDGDLEGAIDLLRKKGTKDRGDRIAGEGLILSYVSDDGKTGVLIELNSETDFVAKNEDFKALGRALAMKAANSHAETVEQLLAEAHEDTEASDKTVAGRSTRRSTASARRSSWDGSFGLARPRRACDRLRAQHERQRRTTAGGSGFWSRRRARIPSSWAARSRCTSRSPSPST